MGFESVGLALGAGLTFAVLTILGPGIGLQRAIGVRVDPALVLPLGTAFCAGAYFASLVSHPALFPVLAVLANAPCLWPRRTWRFAEGPSLRGALPPAAALLCLLAATQYPWNRLDPHAPTPGDRAFLLDPLVPFDSAFHVGLARELTVGYPPELPGVSGFPLGYHLGTDLIRAAALAWANVSPWDALSRLDVTLHGLGLILVLRALAARIGCPPAVVAWVPWTLFAGDYSFLFAPLPSAHWWTDLLRGNLLLSLVLANPVVPALTLALGALVAYSRHEEEGERRWLVPAAVLAAAVPFFKVFLGAHLLLGIGVVWLSRWRKAARTRPLLLLAIPCGIATAGLALGQGGQTVDVVVSPFDLTRVTRDSLGLPPLSGLAVAAWAAFWVVASLGLRMIGLVPAWQALRRGPGVAAVLAVMGLSAWPLGLLVRISAPEVLPGQKFVNDAGYLLEQGGPLLWVFTVVGLVSLATSARRRRFVTVAAILLAVPSTLHFAIKKSAEPPDPLPAATVRAMRALEGVSRPGDVVLQRPGARFPPAPVILIGRRVPYERFTPYLTQFAPRAALEARHETVFRFFQTTDAREARTIARSLRARFLALYGRDRVRFDTAGILEVVHDEKDARVYRFIDAAPE